MGNVNWTVVGIIIAAVVHLVALVGAYYGLKADNALLSTTMQLSTLTEKADRRAEYAQLKGEVMGLVNAAATKAQDLDHRVGVLETGQDEWTKTLRDRTHELANMLQSLVLKVDRLERPTHPAV